MELTQESNVVLTTEKSWRLRGTADFLYVNFPQMGHILTVNDVILLDSGTVVLQVKTIGWFFFSIFIIIIMFKCFATNLLFRTVRASRSKTRYNKDLEFFINVLGSI